MYPLFGRPCGAGGWTWGSLAIAPLPLSVIFIKREEQIHIKLKSIPVLTFFAGDVINGAVKKKMMITH